MNYLVVSGVLLGCSSSTSMDMDMDAGGIEAPIPACIYNLPPEELIFLRGTEVFPSDRLVDWISYADAVAVFSVTDEAVFGDNEIFVRRQLTSRVEAILWKPEAGAVDLAVGDVIHIEGMGWSGTRENLRPFRFEDSVRMLVGDSYLAPLFRPDEKPWGSLSPRAIIPTEGGLLESLECLESVGARHPLWTVIGGQSIDLVAEMLALEPRDPIVERFRHLRPRQRLEAVQAAR